MRQSSRSIAEAATFRSFANCYFREIDPGRAARQRFGDFSVDCQVWELSGARVRLCVEVTARSLCGPLGFGPLRISGTNEEGWRECEPIPAMILLLQEAYLRMSRQRTDLLRRCEAELLSRLLDSCRAISDGLDFHAPREESFIAAEQSLLFGHWLHPAPKSRQGIAFWQEAHYAPELRGDFQLVFFAVDPALVRHDSTARESAVEIARALLGPDFDDCPDSDAILPMHPLQAQALMLDPEIERLCRAGAIRLLGSSGPRFTATSSVRTVYSADCPWMLKFSLPVRITNSVRVNRRHELFAGAAMARLIERTQFCQRHPRFKVIADPAHMTIELPGRSESGFEVIFRENPFVRGRDQGIVTIAALTAEPVPGERSRLAAIVAALAGRTGASLAEAAAKWFDAYLDHALDPLIRLYDEHGIALEAHQQNSLLDVSDLYPRAFYYRDNQGFYLSNDYRGSLEALVPETGDIPDLYFDACEIHDRFAYYLLVNQVFSVVSRLGQDGLIEEDRLLARLRQRLDRHRRDLPRAGGEFAARVLDEPTIAAKANLLTRLFDIDELETRDTSAVYVQIPNPIPEPIVQAQHHAAAL